MPATPVIIAYLTAAEADAYVSTQPEWVAATGTQKDDALYHAAIWTDTNYSHDWEVGDAEIPDEILRANALLACVHLANELFKNFDNVKKERVKAGSVEVENEYRYQEQKDIRLKVIHSLLSSVATRINLSGEISLMRV